MKYRYVYKVVGDVEELEFVIMYCQSLENTLQALLRNKIISQMQF